MKASEARKLTHDHSKRMQSIYKKIQEAAKSGDSGIILFVTEASKEELDVLRNNGFTAGYETSDTDGGQFISIKW